MSKTGKGEWGLKVLSLLVAVVLWVYVSNELNPTKEQEYKELTIEIRGVGANLAVSELPGNATLRVQASQSVISELNPKAIEVFVDLSSIKAGKNRVPIQVNVPSGVKVVELRPQIVSVNVEPFTEKQVSVKAGFFGRVAKGYKVLTIKPKPDDVILRGPKSVLDKINFASADVQLKGRKLSFSETVPIRLEDKSGNSYDERLIKRSPSTADVFVSVVPELPTKTVQIIPRITSEPIKGTSGQD